MPVDDQVVAPGDNAVFLKPSVSTVEEAIARQEEITRYIEAHEPRRELDGVACFNYLYTVITKRVHESIDNGFFDDRVFLAQLDVAFANRYFDALRVNVTDPGKTPRAWKVLIERRAHEDIESIQFAVAGVNAHVNFDLSLAVIETCGTLRTEPNSGSQHADYQKVNQIFAEEMELLRQHYEDKVQREVDDALSSVLNLACDFSVVAARDAAWEVAEHMHLLRRVGINESTIVDQLDRAAALSGHLLLTSHR